jgi:hypothetical protein
MGNLLEMAPMFRIANAIGMRDIANQMFEFANHV